MEIQKLLSRQNRIFLTKYEPEEFRESSEAEQREK